MKMIVDVPEEDINKIKNIRFLIGGKEDRLLQQSIIRAIKNSTPVVLTDISEKEKGEWICIDEEDDKLNRYKCSRCGEIIRLYDKETLHDYPFSHCGADMRDEKKEED